MKFKFNSLNKEIILNGPITIEELKEISLIFDINYVWSIKGEIVPIKSSVYDNEKATEKIQFKEESNTNWDNPFLTVKTLNPYSFNVPEEKLDIKKSRTVLQILDDINKQKFSNENNPLYTELQKALEHELLPYTQVK